MSKNVNFEAYSSIERLSSYESREALLEYRDGRLARYQSVVDFISIRSLQLYPISIIEIGSGSSALLYAIAQRQLLEKGMGVELSQSRYQFAETWKQDDGYGMVENVNSNFSDANMGTSLWDWFVIIDNTFTYLHPEDAAYPSQLLHKAFDGLRQDGQLLIDIINYSKRLPDIDYRQWSAFSQKDPYSYGLYSNKIVDGVNHCESIFLGRDGSESRKIEMSKVYSLKEITDLLESCGFSVQETFSTFSGDPFVEGESERLVIVAKKKFNLRASR